MKYKIQHSYKKHIRNGRLPRKLIAQRSRAALFPIGQKLPLSRSQSLPSVREAPAKSTLRSFWHKFLTAFKMRIISWLGKEPRVSTLKLCGLLCGVLTVTILAGIVALYSLFGKYGGVYKSVRIPDLTGSDIATALATSNELFEYELKYESNPDAPSGSVISQTPPANVVRKLYRSDGKLKITLTVSREPDEFILPKLMGGPLRDATLMLKSAGITVTVHEQYSSLPSGTVLISSLPAGSKLTKGDSITLTVSKGKETVYVSIPSLEGMGEREAIELLEKSSLKVGEISYKSSKLPIGTVISQGISAGTPLPEGSSVPFCVSGGMYYTEH